MPEVCVVEAQFAGGDHVGRVQGERALLLGDGFLRAPLDPKDAALLLVDPGPIGIEAELTFDSNSSARARSPLRSPETSNTARTQNLVPNEIRARTLLRSMANTCPSTNSAFSAA